MAAAPKRSKKPVPKPPVASSVLSTKDMAEVLGITPRRLQILVKEGTVPSLGRGKFPLGEVVQAYATFLKEGAERKTGTASLDRLREEKALDIQLTRQRKDRQLISIDEAIGVIDEVVGIFVASLSGLPAQITKVPRERQRLNGIFDTERQRLADRFAEKRSALLEDRAAADPAAEDDAG